MSGILFLKTKKLDDLKDFYIRQVGCEMWLDQADCAILRHGNLLFGFCERDEVQNQAMLTFFYENREEVDRMFDRLKSVAVSEPTQNDKYNIYQFFAHDPEERMVEIQHFNHPAATYRPGDDLLLSRRSIRRFEQSDIHPDVLKQVLDLSRWAPTSRNTQSYYFKFIRDPETLDWLSGTRGKSTSPIGNARLAVAVCSDPAISKRHVQDGCIAAYHFLLAAWFYGLGTCWIAAMDRDDVKQRLKIPPDHYVATVTPLGYPEGGPKAAPERKPSEEFVRGEPGWADAG
jgi:nitroreductase